ncbi:MAG: BREX system ATP-binding domain-containing protein, partial [Pseudomonadota bacterium]|nr:BREX system ATP-binding domain-containing protein [Pseudomonadota bacterium]
MSLMATSEGIEKLKAFQARPIIEELRKGSVPADQVPFFTVGREKWIKFIADDLENYIAQGGAKVRFIRGDYGDGKTHFMSIIRHFALDQGFAVSFVVLTREVPIHKFEAVYQNIVRQLRGNFTGTGIRSLLKQWLDDLAKSETPLTAEQIAEMAENLRNLSGMDISFANALIALLKNHFTALAEEESQEQRTDAEELLLHWFEAGKATKKELKPFAVFEVVNKTNSKLMLNSLNSFLRFIDYKGLVLLLDELETVIAQSASVRNAAYENVRLLIDNSEQAGYLHIFFAIIPDVLLSEKGFKSYDALWSRVRAIGEQDDKPSGKKILNYRGILVDLHQTPLKQEELVNLGQRLRQIHQIAYRWDAVAAVSDQVLLKICENQQKMGLLSEVRLFVKQVIRLLDLARENMTLSQRQKGLKQYAGFRPREFPWWLVNALNGNPPSLPRLRQALKYREVSFYKDKPLSCKGWEPWFQMVCSLAEMFRNA